MLQKSEDFLSKLKKNNNREWFTENKDQYQIAKKEFDNFTESLITDIQSFDQDLGPVEAKDCSFRIYRDVRFSKNKLPYKENMGAFIVKGGKKSGNAGYYFHLEPGNSFVGGGLHMPPNDTLLKIRTDIMNNMDEFKEIINEPKFIEHFKGIAGDKLVNPPKGFPKDFPDIDLLKFKSYTVGQNISNEILNSNKLFEEISASFRTMYKFIRFLNYGIENG